MRRVARQKLLGLANTFVWEGVPGLLPLATIGTFVLLGGSLDPGAVFASLTLLDLVTAPMKLFPEALQWLVQSQVGIRRIERLLLAEERAVLSPPEAPWASVRGGSCGSPVYVRSVESHAAALLQNVELRWAAEGEGPETGRELGSAGSGARCWRLWGRWPPARASPSAETPGEIAMCSVGAPTLGVPSLEVLRGKLVLVVGPVGAGKSTLVQGLLNEVPLVAGRVEVSGRIAYCAQKPWILNATVRDNILFGGDYDQARTLR